MRDRATAGPFKTTGTEQWPIRMCQWIAATLLHSCSAAATTATEGGRAEDEDTGRAEDEDTPENSDKGYPICQPDGHRLQGEAARACETLAVQGLPRRRGALLPWEVAKTGSRASRWGQLVLATERVKESDSGVRGFGEGARDGGLPHGIRWGG